MLSAFVTIVLIITFYLVKNKKLFNQIYYHFIFSKFVLKTFFVSKINEIFGYYMEITRNYGTPNIFYASFLTHYIVDKPEDIQMVLNSAIDRPAFYKFAHNETGLITAEENIWKVQRKLLNPTFNLRILQSFFPIFNEKAKICIKNLEENLDKDSFDISKYFNQLSLDSVCATSFGWDSGVQQGKYKDYLDATNYIPDIIFERIIAGHYHFDAIYKRSKLFLLENKYFHYIYKLSSELIKEKRKEYIPEPIPIKTNKQMEINEDDSVVYNKPQVLLKHLFKLQDEGKITEKSLFEHCDTMIGAGTETTALALSNTILLLAMHPEIQNHVYEELEQVFPNHDVEVSYDDITRLEYLDRVIKESMRLFTIVPHIAKKSSTDIVLKNGFLIKKGVNIEVIFKNLHLNPAIWGENTNKFEPDNFLPEKVAQRHPYSFLPFGAGPRICIGQRYAMFFIKVVLSKILRKYYFTTEHKLDNCKFHYGVTAKLISKHNVQLLKRVQSIE